jgi:hypothetical protein
LERQRKNRSELKLWIYAGLQAAKNVLVNALAGRLILKKHQHLLRLHTVSSLTAMERSGLAIQNKGDAYCSTE